MSKKREMAVVDAPQSTGIGNALGGNVTALGVFRDLMSVANYDACNGNCFFVQSNKNTTLSWLKRNLTNFTDLDKSVAYVVCESSEGSDNFIDLCNVPVPFWTASKFCKNVMVESNPSIQVEVVPHALRYYKHCPDVVNDVFTFFAVFNGSSRLLRKNPFEMIEYFCQAFQGRDDVQFVLKVNHIDDSIIKSMVKVVDNRAKVTIIYGDMDVENLETLYSQCDAYLSLHRAEGFGLTMLEAMAHAKVVIATDWSGNTDFCKEENCLLVDYDLVDVEDDYYRGQWAKVKQDDAIEKMRSAVNNAYRELRQAAFDTALEHSISRLIQRIAPLM